MKRITQYLIVPVGVVCSFFILASGARPGVSAFENSGPPEPARDAAAIYKSKCASCHGKDGRSKTFKAKFNHARNLADAEWQNNITDERIFNSIANGRGKMPAYANKLTQAEIEALVVYVRGLRR
ncbi:MAG TPA: c-type cytochrome [Pyrinomonadaceae bacterium]